MKSEVRWAVEVVKMVLAGLFGSHQRSTGNGRQASPEDYVQRLREAGAI